MPTKRTPRSRTPGRVVTPEAKQMYAEARRLQAQYRRCAFDGRCTANPRPINGAHCDRCARYLDLVGAVDSLLGLKPWQTSPLDAAGEKPNYINARDWTRAKQLREELSK